ncbi:VWA domain-containing protein [Candidatus Poribacteria bacterium]
MISKMGQRWTNNNALLISLSLHILVAIFVANLPIRHRIRWGGRAVSVSWVKEVPEPELERELPKKPTEMKSDPTRKLAFRDRDKLSKAAPHKIAYVKKESNRLVERSVKINDAPRSNEMPEIMTETQIRNSQLTMSGLVSTDRAPIDGRGVVGDHVKAKGHGKSGVSILSLDGTGDGIAGGGGDGGLSDQLGIINFMKGAHDPQKVVYCLDVSSSMAKGSKLPAAIESLKESMMHLSDFDEFNIVTFYSEARRFRKKAMPATPKNLGRAGSFLNSFTRQNVKKNRGTNILIALRHALRMKPSVIVLITDMNPTRGVVDENAIAAKVRRLNKNNTRIYGIGVAVRELSPTGRLARLLKLLAEQNDGKMRLASSG